MLRSVIAAVTLVWLPLACAEDTPKPAGPIVVALGDSITKGARPARDEMPEVRTEDTFVYLLEQRLQADHPGAKVINAGVSGNRTDQAVERLERDVLAHRPAAVLVMFGTNDSCWDVGKDGPRLPVEQYEQNLREIVARVRERGGEPILMTPIPLGTRWGAERNAVYVAQGPNGPITAYVEACRRVASEMNTLVVDHFALWQAEPDGTIDARTTDRCHPNAEGHAVLAAAIAPVLKASLQAASVEAARE